MIRIFFGFTVMGLVGALAGCSSSSDDRASATGGAGVGSAGSAGHAGSSSTAGLGGSGGASSASGGAGGSQAGAAQGGSLGSAGSSFAGSAGAATGGTGGASGSAGTASGGTGGSAGASSGGGGTNAAVKSDCTTLCGVWTKVSMCSLGTDCITQCESIAQHVASPTKYQTMLDCEAKSLTKTTEYFCSGGALISTDEGTGPAPTIKAATTTACKQEICDFTCNEASNNGLYDTNVCTTDACQCSDC